MNSYTENQQYPLLNDIAFNFAFTQWELTQNCSKTILISDYVYLKDLPLCWDQHTKLLPVVNKYSANDVMKWSSEQVAGFVNCLPGCSPQGKVFHEEVIEILFVHRRWEIRGVLHSVHIFRDRKWWSTHVASSVIHCTL